LTTTTALKRRLARLEERFPPIQAGAIRNRAQAARAEALLDLVLGKSGDVRYVLLAALDSGRPYEEWTGEELRALALLDLYHVWYALLYRVGTDADRRGYAAHHSTVEYCRFIVKAYGLRASILGGEYLGWNDYDNAQDIDNYPAHQYETTYRDRDRAAGILCEHGVKVEVRQPHPPPQRPMADPEPIEAPQYPPERPEPNPEPPETPRRPAVMSPSLELIHELQGQRAARRG